MFSILKFSIQTTCPKLLGILWKQFGEGYVICFNQDLIHADYFSFSIALPFYSRPRDITSLKFFPYMRVSEHQMMPVSQKFLDKLCARFGVFFCFIWLRWNLKPNWCNFFPMCLLCILSKFVYKHTHTCKCITSLRVRDLLASFGHNLVWLLLFHLIVLQLYWCRIQCRFLAFPKNGQNVFALLV